MTQRHTPPGGASRTWTEEQRGGEPMRSSRGATVGRRIRQRPAAEEPAVQRVKRLKADPLKFELLRRLSLDPYAWHRVADLAESLSVESADAKRAVGSLLGESLIVSRPDAGGTVFVISKSLSNHAFLRKLLGDVHEEPAPTGRG